MTRTREDEALIAAGRNCLTILIDNARSADPADWSPAYLGRMEEIIFSAGATLSAHLEDDGCAPNKNYARIAETTASVLLLEAFEPEAADRVFGAVRVSGIPDLLLRVFRASSLMRSLCDDHDYGVEDRLGDGRPIVVHNPSGPLADLSAISRLVLLNFGGPENFDLAVSMANRNEKDVCPFP